MLIAMQTLVQRKAPDPFPAFEFQSALTQYKGPLALSVNLRMFVSVYVKL